MHNCSQIQMRNKFKTGQVTHMLHPGKATQLQQVCQLFLELKLLWNNCPFVGQLYTCKKDLPRICNFCVLYSVSTFVFYCGVIPCGWQTNKSDLLCIVIKPQVMSGSLFMTWSLHVGEECRKTGSWSGLQRQKQERQISCNKQIWPQGSNIIWPSLDITKRQPSICWIFSREDLSFAFMVPHHGVSMFLPGSSSEETIIQNKQTQNSLDLHVSYAVHGRFCQMN